jgi:hypothetical protein
MQASPFVTRTRLGNAALGVWFASMVVLGAGLLARHVVALPTPAPSALLAASIDGLRTPATRGKWLAVHVLYAPCRCSQRIADHLLSTERPRDWSEVVLWVGASPTPPAGLEQRFDVRRIGTADLSRYGLESAPMLVTVDPDGRIRYAGGYTERKQGPVVDDLRILDASRGATSLLAGLPIFGCAVSERLQREFRALPIP